jgi:hypothetical protein
MSTTQTTYVQGIAPAHGGDSNSLRDELQCIANWLHIANATRDYDRAKHAYELARRSYEIAARNQQSNSPPSQELDEVLLDLGARLNEFEQDLYSYTCWSDRPVH